MLRKLLTVALAALAAEAVAAAGLAVELDTGGAEWIRRDQPFTLRLDRPLEPGDGRLAVLVGSTDTTDLFRATPEVLVYRPELRPLPAGETEVVVYRVSAQGAWEELERIPLRVLTDGGFRSAEIKPQFDLASQGLIDEGGETTGGERGLEDWTGQIGLDTSLARGGWAGGLRFNIQGATVQEQALRFDERGAEAPAVDLSSYSLRVERTRSWLELGHLAWGSSRHLMDGFESRGAALALPLWRGAEVSVTALNGSSIVGWNNILGLAESDHQIVAGRIGAELLPARPGTLHLGVTLLDGSLLPAADFNQGAITDAERSDGLGLDLRAEGWSGRARLAASWAESRFDNPFDPELAQGSDLVAVAEEERHARGLDMELDLARERPLGERFTTSWTLGYHHSRTEPQYRSVAAFVQADRENDRLELAGMLGPAALQIAHAESRDNLDDIPSILTTRSDTDVATLAVPLGQLRSEPSVWLPLLSYSLERTHQKGDGVPVDSGFSESHVPDQVSRNHNASLDWSGGVWRFGYRFNRSEQDNRQPGRERADFETQVHALAGALGFARLDLGFDLSEEDSRSFELGQRGETRRYGLNLLWRTTDRLTWNGTLARVRSETDPETDESESWDGDLQLTLRLGPWGGDRHGISSQLHLRYTSSQLNLANPLFGFVEDRRTWALRSGLSLSVF